MLDAAREDLEILRRRYLSAVSENEDRQQREWPQYANGAAHPGVSGKASAQAALAILDYGPKQASLREGFNLQPNGRSAMWQLASAKPPDRCQISFDGELLDTTISNCLVTATIPQPLLELPGVVKINLVDDAGRMIADEVEFSIT